MPVDNLRKRCENLYWDMHQGYYSHGEVTKLFDLIESFAREIRNEALEESATRIEVIADMDKDYGGDPSGRRDLRLLCAGMVRAIKATSDLAANGSENK